MPPNLQAEMAVELDRARAARRAGNEGRARVCARRAAGMAAKAFLARRGTRPGSGSAYETLHTLASLPGLDPRLAAAAGRLTLRVDEAFGLPQGIDLIAEAVTLIHGLEQPT